MGETTIFLGISWRCDMAIYSPDMERKRNGEGRIFDKHIALFFFVYEAMG